MTRAAGIPAPITTEVAGSLWTVEIHDPVEGHISSARPRVSLSRDGEPVGQDVVLDLLAKRFRAEPPLTPAPPRSLAEAAVKALLRRRVVEVREIVRAAPPTGWSRVGGLPPVDAAHWPRSERKPHPPMTHLITVDLSVIELPPYKKVAVSVFGDLAGNELRVQRGLAVRFTPAEALEEDVVPPEGIVPRPEHPLQLVAVRAPREELPRDRVGSGPTARRGAPEVAPFVFQVSATTLGVDLIGPLVVGAKGAFVPV